MKIYTKSLISILFVAAIYTSAQAQEPKKEQTKEVVVEKEYEPVVREAERITLLPEFEDTAKVQIDFDYNIRSSAMYGKFAPRAIKPAKLMGEPIYPIEHAYILLGVGNYLSGIGQVRVNSLRNQEHQWFAGADFFGSFGKIKDQWNRDVKLNSTDTEILANGKKFFKRSALEGNIQFNNNRCNYYGQAISPTEITIPDSLLTDDYQSVTRFNADISLYSFDRSSKKANFTTTLTFNHLQAKNDVVEDKFGLNVYVDKYYDKQFLGMEAKFKYINNENLPDTISNFFIDFNPWLGLFGKTWRIQVGANSTYNEHITKYYLYPNVKLHYNIAAFFLVPYVEVTGNYQLNTFERMVDENFFINPRLSVEPTNNKLIVNGGIRCMVSSRLGFNANATYQKTANQYFYVPDTSDLRGRFFTVEYDNMSIFSVGGELSWKQSDQLNIILRGQYSTYTLDSLAAPWHLPRIVADLTVRYRLIEKLTLSSDLFYRGERTVKKVDGTQGVLDPLVDLNIMAEYQLNRIFGFFIKGCNILNRRQYVYDNYQMHRLHVLAGAKILF